MARVGKRVAKVSSVSGSEFIGKGKKLDEVFNLLCRAIRRGARKEIERLSNLYDATLRGREQRRYREHARRMGIPTIQERREGYL